MTAPTYRAPTVDEAVLWLLVHRRPWALSYRRLCLRYWREKVGESFELKVRTEFLKRWKQRKAETS